MTPSASDSKPVPFFPIAVHSIAEVPHRLPSSATILPDVARDWFRFKEALTWLWRIAMLIGMVVTLMTRFDARYVTRDLFLSEMQRVEQKIDALGFRK